MGPGIILLFVLVAVFAMASVPHLLVWMRNPTAREHLWFASACLAAAGAAAAYCLVYRGASDASILLAQRVSVSFSVVWLVATTWFTVEYAGSDHRRRAIAGLVTLMFACVLLGNSIVPTPALPMYPAAPRSLLSFLDNAALLLLFGLVLDATIRLWRSTQRFRAATIGCGIGIAVIAFGLHGMFQAWGLTRLPSPIPYAFLIAVVLMTYELAATVAEMQALSQRQRQELAHASRLSIVGELTASIAHEINQPLGAILSNADAGEMLLEHPDPPLDEVRQILADIRRDGLRASDVIRHVRTLVRNREFMLERLDANAVAADVVGLVDPDARRRRISLQTDLLPDPAYFRGDRTHMEQVLINLMLNALDSVEALDAVDGAGSARQPILLGVSRTVHGEIEFRCVDAGQGIPRERLDKLFTSFHSSKPHGMGLGLSIARSIVEAHGGRIRAENNAGAGAMFRVTLPPFAGLDG